MKRKHILIEFGLPYFQHTRDRIRGILEYAKRNCPEWEFLSDPFDFFQAFQPGFLPLEKADGIFLTAYRPNATTREVLEKRIPAINLSRPDEDFGIPVVTADDLLIGRAAANHLDMPVITETLFIGPEGFRSQLRLEGFATRLQELGKKPPHSLIEVDEIRQGTAMRRLKLIISAIKRLRQTRPARLGVFTFSDSFAHAVTKACAALHLAIPHDVAILGCDNEQLVCNLGTVPLSSIPPDNHRVGLLAAERLHDLMQGRPVPPVTLIEPCHPIERLSTSHIEVEDPVVAKALGVIREKASTGLRVYEMLDYLPISRRSLETRFRKALGRSPHEEIDRVRIDLAFARLARNDGTNAKIAIDCGFSSATHFEQAFRKHTGHPPSHYRPASSEKNFPKKSPLPQ